MPLLSKSQWWCIGSTLDRSASCVLDHRTCRFLSPCRIAGVDELEQNAMHRLVFGKVLGISKAKIKVNASEYALDEGCCELEAA